MPLTFSSKSLGLANSNQANTSKTNQTQAGANASATNDSLTRSRVAPEDSAAKKNKSNHALKKRRKR